MKKLTHSRRRAGGPRGMRGTAAVEFAILLIPLVTMVLGVAEFGRAIYQYEALTKATRDATRYLSEFSPSDVAYPVADAQCLAVTGQLTSSQGCSGKPLVPGLTSSMVVICDRVASSGCPGVSFGNIATYDANNGASSGSPAGTVNLVEVKITGFTYVPLGSFILSTTGLPFNNIATVMRQVL
ncbi:Flp pilus assembly protein TadG [Burkholderia sp. OK233]|nr:Flp pilus assembly protein TadG [Burkholderia sp. OK233]